VCNQFLKPMTDEQWKVNQRQHLTSLRHQRYAMPAAKRESAKAVVL
jgi:hypothetical protein